MKEITVIGEVINSKGIKGVVREKTTLFVNGATRTGEIYMINVKNMVAKVTAEADGDKISRLNIIDHGDKTGGYFGEDWIDENNFQKFAPYLAKLYPLFGKSAIVHLQHCDMGKNKNLLQMFAAIFGATVYAGTGAHNSAARFNWGEYVRCSPSGTIYNNVKHTARLRFSCRRLGIWFNSKAIRLNSPKY